MIEINRVMSISTAHITEKTADLLIKGELEPAVYPKDKYGWFIFVPKEIVAVPDDLGIVMDFARRHGCSWIDMDCAGNTVPFLPTYEWH